MQLQHSISFGVDGDAFIAMIGIPSASSASRPLRDEVAPAHQVVGSGAEAKQPVDEASAAVAEFPKEPYGLHPAKGLFDQFPFALAHGVAGMARGAAIDGAPSGTGVLRHVRRDAHPTHGPDPGTPVEELVGGH